MIYCKRVYEAAHPNDGKRILVDRLWPRGLRKDQLIMDQWLKEVAPSTALRQWFHAHMEQTEEFRTRYRNELAGHPEHWLALLDIARAEPLTLLYAARQMEHSHASVLAEFLEDELDKWQDNTSPVCYAHLHSQP
ncbi:DUF488 domain-containing protein [Alkanindiges sp. WGS2144]|uniref:DUF488 domain-containing protein n=1 Tax=Alkanindiges sp. WGS2144 TaxID=3366808 RepID=UPI0037506EB1